MHIVAYLSYAFFEGRPAFRLTRWRYAQMLTSTMWHSMLVDLATAYLVAQRGVLPGVTVLARLIAWVRERTGRHIYRQLRTRLTPAHQAVWETDVACLSPLLHEHVNMLGCYDFTLPEAIAAGQLRPLRTPTNWETSPSALA